MNLPDLLHVCAPRCVTSPPHSASRSLVTRRPGSSGARRQRPAVAEGEQDGKDGSVGAVGHARGSRVRRGSDRHGLGARGVASAVLTDT